MSFRWNWSYVKITKDAMEEKEEDSYSDSNLCSNDTMQTRHCSWRLLHLSRIGQPCVIAIIFISVVFLGIGLSAVIFHKASSSQNTLRHNNLCGNSTEDAISLGCSFNQLLWAWLPAHCPHYANEDFTKAENWTYYQDFHGNGEISSEHVIEAMDKGIKLWTQQREHVSHCVFMFLGLGQVIRDGSPYTEKLTDYTHIKHCVELILEVVRQDSDWHNITTSVPGVDYNSSC
ncbi:hypothetical protein V8C40DRAFT_253264 [Trichoderma camerunense]